MAEEHADLARRCLDGDEAALREFIESFQQPVFSLCLRMLHHWQDAEDVAQESLVRAVRYLGSWNPAHPLAPWVMKIASNRCRTALGRRARLPVVVQSAPERSVSSSADGAALAEELERALGTLKENCRISFVLFYHQELSVAEIAELMEIPEGTIKTWLHRSRKQLAKTLKERGLSPRLHET